MSHDRRPKDLLGQPLRGATPPKAQFKLNLSFGNHMDGSLPVYRLEVWPSDAGKDRSREGVKLQEAIADLGGRWAVALLERYPGMHRAKRIARDFDVEPRTAKGWLAGQAPSSKYLVLAWQLFGPLMVAEVLAPDSDWHRGAHVGAAVAELEDRLKNLGDELVVLRRGAS